MLSAYHAFHTRPRWPYPLVIIGIGLAALVVALTVSYVVSESAAAWLGVSLSAPTKEQANGGLYAAVVVASVCISFAINMYLAAWLTGRLLVALKRFTPEKRALLFCMASIRIDGFVRPRVPNLACLRSTYGDNRGRSEVASGKLLLRHLVKVGAYDA